MFGAKRRESRQLRELYLYSCRHGAKEKGSRLLSATVAGKKTATVAVLPRRKERERRRFSDYSCSVAAKKKRKGDGLATTVAVLPRRKGKKTATTVAVLPRRRKGKETA